MESAIVAAGCGFSKLKQTENCFTAYQCSGYFGFCVQYLN